MFMKQYVTKMKKVDARRGGIFREKKSTKEEQYLVYSFYGLFEGIQLLSINQNNRGAQSVHPLCTKTRPFRSY